MRQIREFWDRGWVGKVVMIGGGSVGLLVACCTLGLVIGALSSTPRRTQPTTVSVAQPVAQVAAIEAPKATDTPQPTEPPPLTNTPEPTTTITPTPTPAVPTGEAVSEGYLRNTPGIGVDNAIGFLCPGDAIEFIGQQAVEGNAWYHIRVTTAAPDCKTTHVRAGTEGWASHILVSSPHADVPIDLSSTPPTATPSPTRLPTARPTPRPTAVPAPAPSSGGRVGAVCRDGTRSSATGRGACSHHGGVDHWLYGP